MHDGQAMDLQSAIPAISLLLNLFTKPNELSLHKQFLLPLKNHLQINTSGYFNHII